MKIKKCNPYNARTVAQGLLHMPDKKSVFKIYYVSITGRAKPELYEWEHCLHTQTDFEQDFLNRAFEGIGFVTAFPHISKVFRFSPYAETVLDVIEFNTIKMQPKDCSREDGSHEFACFAESVISAEEFVAWAKAATVAEYLKFRCSKTEFSIFSNQKLAEYWQ